MQPSKGDHVSVVRASLDGHAPALAAELYFLPGGERVVMSRELMGVDVQTLDAYVRELRAFGLMR